MKTWQRKTIGFLILISLTAIVVSLPFWNPSPMNTGAKVIWWLVFGGVITYLWYAAIKCWYIEK